jgi:hypothetical protein
VVVNVAGSRFSNSRLVTVIPTFYRDPNGDDAVRWQLACKTLQRYDELNKSTSDAYPVVIADASPDPGVRAAFRQFAEVILDCSTNGGIAPQSFAGIRYALDQGARLVARHSPEKYGWASADLLEGVVSSLNGGIDLLAASRSIKSFRTLPRNQRLTETVISRLVARLRHDSTGRYLPEDTASGMRAMTVAGAEHVLRFDYERYGKAWEFEWFTLITGIIEGKITVDSLAFDYQHPQEMCEAEENSPDYDQIRVDQADVVLPKVLEFALANGFSLDTGPKTWTI